MAHANGKEPTRIEYQGQNLTLKEWSEKTGIPYPAIMRRLRLNWTPDKILTEPVYLQGKRKITKTDAVRWLNELPKDKIPAVLRMAIGDYRGESGNAFTDARRDKLGYQRRKAVFDKWFVEEFVPMKNKEENEG